MKPQDIERFFSQLAKEYPCDARIWMLGGAAALLLGGSRPTMDIDFEVKLSDDTPEKWQDFDKAIRQTQHTTGILAQYAQSVERWSQVSYLEFRDSATLWKHFGRLRVYLFSPQHWSIGKITRFLQQDCDDMVAVFSRTRPDPKQLAQLWLRALRHSPHSADLSIVKKNMHYFFKQHGHTIWGKSPKGVAAALKLLA